MITVPPMDARLGEFTPGRNGLSAVTPKFTLTHIGVFLFVLVFYARPSDWIPGAAPIPTAKVVAGIAILGFLGSLLMQPTQTLRAIRLRRPIVGVMALYGWMWLTVPTSAWKGNSVGILSSDFLEVVLMTTVIAVSTTSPARLKRLLGTSIIIASVASVFAILSFRTLATGDQRIHGIFQNVFSNPNDLALNVVILLPFAVALMFLGRGLKKILWLACAGLMTFGVLVSFSRAGFLALLAAAAVMLFDLGVKTRKFFLLPLVLLLAIGASLFLPGSFGSRMATIFNPNSEGSAVARRQLLIDSLVITAHHPLFGVGPGNFLIVSESWQGTHNIFTQLSSETGIPGLLLYIWVLRETFRDIRRVRQRANDRNIRLLVGAARSSMLALLVGTFFYHTIFQFFTYFPIAYATSLAGMGESTAVPSAECSNGVENHADAIPRVVGVSMPAGSDFFERDHEKPRRTGI